MINNWNLDLKRQVNIIIGEELGKTCLLKRLYSNAIPINQSNDLEHINGSYGVGFVPCDSPLYEGLGEGQSRLNYINFTLDKVETFRGPKLLIIDNPERGLHVDIQRKLIQNLINVSGPHTKLIVATHSPTIYYSGWTHCVVRANE